MVVINTLVDIISLEPFYPPYDADGGGGGVDKQTPNLWLICR